MTPLAHPGRQAGGLFSRLPVGCRQGAHQVVCCACVCSCRMTHTVSISDGPVRHPAVCLCQGQLSSLPSNLFLPWDVRLSVLESFGGCRVRRVLTFPSSRMYWSLLFSAVSPAHDVSRRGSEGLEKTEQDIQRRPKTSMRSASDSQEVDSTRRRRNRYMEVLFPGSFVFDNCRAS